MMICFRFRESSQTFWPCVKGVNVECFWLAIREHASSCAAKASSLSAINRFIFSSMEGNLVGLKATGMEIGLSPRINLKGVCVLSACLLLLCVNSRVLRDFGQSSGCDEQ